MLVVGPSGAGKDSLLRHAMTHFAGDTRLVFPRRLVTRAADASAEDHDSVDSQRFEELAKAGALALSWGAHGLQYGVRRDIDAHLAEGQIVVVNVSRTILEQASRDYPNAVIAEISAEPHLRAARIAARGRETHDDAERRSQRILPLPPVTAIFMI